MTAPAAAVELTIDEARAELDAVEARAAELRAEFDAVNDRANGLRQYLAAALIAQAEALLARVETKEMLTRREIEFARMYAVSQEPLAELARRHYVSVNTAKTHIKNAYRKLGVTDRSQLRQALSDASRRSAGTPRAGGDATGQAA